MHSVARQITKSAHLNFQIQEISHSRSKKYLTPDPRNISLQKTSSYYSKFQSLVSRLANALSGQANHKIRTPQEPEKWVLIKWGLLENYYTLCVSKNRA